MTTKWLIRVTGYRKLAVRLLEFDNPIFSKSQLRVAMDFSLILFVLISNKKLLYCVSTIKKYLDKTPTSKNDVMLCEIIKPASSARKF